MTIWTAALVTEVEVTDDAGNDRTVTTANIILMLVAGWIFYFGSQLLNYIYYKIHPSFPEMWTWGKEEELEEWTPPGEKQTQEGEKNQSSKNDF